MEPLAPVTARVMLRVGAEGSGTGMIIAAAARILCVSEGEGDDCLAVGVVGGVEGFVAGGFLCGYSGVELGCDDLLCGGVDEAELAGGEIAFGRAQGWADGGAEDGSGFV